MRLNACSKIDLQAERRKHTLRAIRPLLQNQRPYIKTGCSHHDVTFVFWHFEISSVFAFSEAEVTVSEREGRVINRVGVHSLPVSVKGNICNTFTTRGQNSTRGCTEMFLPSLKRLRTCF